MLLDGQSWRVLAVMPANFAFPDPGSTSGSMGFGAVLRGQASPAGRRATSVPHVIARLGPGGRAGKRRSAWARSRPGWRAPPAGNQVGRAASPLADELVRTRARRCSCSAAGRFVLLIIAPTSPPCCWRAPPVAGTRCRARRARGLRPRPSGNCSPRAWCSRSRGAAGCCRLAGLGPARLARAGDIPRLDEVRIDATVLSFTLGVAVLTGVVFGLAPALQGSRVDLTSGLKEGGGKGGGGGRARHRMRGLLVVSELAIALVLLVGAGLFARSFARVAAVDPGFDPRNLLVMRVFLNTAAYGSGRSRTTTPAAARAARRAAGVTAVAATTVLPMMTSDHFYRPYWRGGEADPGGQAPRRASAWSRPSI